MEHVVFFPAPDGSPAFRRLASLEEAVRFVEHLRNVEGVDQFSVHTLAEVPLAFKAYYRVEVPHQADGVLVPEQPVAEHEAPLPMGAEGVPALAVVPEAPQALAEVPLPTVAPEQEQPTEAAKASMGFFSRG